MPTVIVAVELLRLTSGCLPATANEQPSSYCIVTANVVVIVEPSIIAAGPVVEDIAVTGDDASQFEGIQSCQQSARISFELLKPLWRLAVGFQIGSWGQGEDQY